MFCEKCGAKNPNNAQFCASCGEKIPEHITSAPARSVKPRIIGLIAVVLVVALAIVGGFFLFGGRSADSTAKLVMNGLMDFDLVKIYDLVPDPVRESILEQNGVTEEEFKQSLIEDNEELMESLESFGSIVTWKYNGLEDVSEATLVALKEQYTNYYDIEISDAKTMAVHATVTVFGMSETNDFTFNLIKYKGSWYVDHHTIGNVF